MSRARSSPTAVASVPGSGSDDAGALVESQRRLHEAEETLRAIQHGEVNGFAWTLNAIPLPGPPGIWAPTAIKLQVGNGSGDVVEIDAVTLRKQAAK